MAKLDNIINSKFFFICEKNKESVSIKNHVVHDSALDDEYLKKIKTLLKKKKNRSLEAAQGLGLSQISMKEYYIFSHMSPFELFSLKLASSKADDAALLRKSAKNTVEKSTAAQSTDKYHNLYSALDPPVEKKNTSSSFSAEHNLRKGIPLEFSSATLLAQEKKALIEDGSISVKSHLYAKKSLSTNKKDRESELPQVSLPLGSHLSTELKAVPVSELPVQLSKENLRVPFSLSENALVTSEKTLIFEGDNGMVYHFNKWKGLNSVRIQWDQKDKHRVYLEPSNTNVLHHIADRIAELPPKLKVVLQEEQQHSRQRNPNENREDKKGKR